MPVAAAATPPKEPVTKPSANPALAAGKPPVLWLPSNVPSLQTQAV